MAHCFAAVQPTRARPPRARVSCRCWAGKTTEKTVRSAACRRPRWAGLESRRPEVVAVVEILDQTWPRWLPAEALASQFARRGGVDRPDQPREAEVVQRVFGWNRRHGHVHVAADRLGNGARWYTLFGDRMP